MTISLIAAMAKNYVIGKGNELPWHIPGDLQWFKDQTLGKSIIMGRKSFLSLGKALPKRKNIVISRDPSFTAENAIVCRNIDEALAQEHPHEEIMITGGGVIYDLCLQQNLIDKMYLTIVDAEVDGDVFFPKFNWENWECTEEQVFEKADDADYGYKILTLVRK